jgi:hypothetical protein
MWFTNNRKRKYQKVTAIAKNHDKDISFVWDMIKIKFNKDLEHQSNTDTISDI